MVCAALSGCCTTVGNGFKSIPNGCKNFWWTKDSRFEANVVQKVPNLTTLKLYDLAFRITFLALLAVEIAGFALLAVGCKTPPPFHPLIGLYVCVGGLVIIPTVLAIINCKREAYCKSVGIIPDKTHTKNEQTAPPTRRDSIDSDS